MSWWREGVKLLCLLWGRRVIRICELCRFEVRRHSRQVGPLIVTEMVLCSQKELALLCLKNLNMLGNVGQRYTVS